MPIGAPTYFEGDIRKSDPNSLGFFYCNVESPFYLDHPIIQTHIKTSTGIRTVSGLGKWSMWIFSEEMDNAIKLGYKFNIKKGYLFKKGFIFKEFIQDLYQMRLTYSKTNHMNNTAKIKMNSLCGRFGMDENFGTMTLINTHEFESFISKSNELLVIFLI